jgi:Tfp pilus assembly PilM family ATPase
VWQSLCQPYIFHKNRGDNGTSYYLQVKTANNKITHLDQTFKFTLQPGDPSPGICSLSPVSAPLPFPEGNVMQIRGEYFGTDSEVYFWKSGAQAKTIDGRIPVTHNNLNSSSDTLLTLRPPTTLTTGPVIVYRPKDKKMSNPASFTVLDCVKNNNSCTTAGTVCCASGRDTGICKAVNELCSGAPASSGYVSRFSTADIPAIPHVVERCNDDTNVGKNIPTPAPSIQWDVRDTDEHHNVCRTALVTAEFTQALNQATVNNSTVLVNKCSSNKDINDCENPVPITLTADSYTLKAAVGQTGGILRHYLSLSPSTGRWDDATWYQVVFKKGISSQDKILFGPIENVDVGQPVKDLFGSLVKLFTAHKEKFENVEDVSVSIPAEGVFFRNVEVPKIIESDMQKLVLAEIKKTLPVDFSQVLFAQNDLGEKHEGRKSFFCVGIQKMLFENYKTVFGKFGLSPYFEIEVFSLARITQRDNQHKLILQVGRTNTFLIFVEGQIIQDVKLIEMGENEINKNISKDLELQFTQVETLKENIGRLQDANRLGAKIIDEYLKDFNQKLAKAVSLYILEYEKKQNVEIKEVIISGSKSTNKIKKVISDEFDAELKVDFVNENNFGEFIAENFLLDELKRYAQCFGLALRR